MDGQVVKIEGFTPDMLWIFFVVLVGIMALVVLGDKVMDVFRKSQRRRKEQHQLNGQDITEQIADKVIEKLTPQIDEKFAQFDTKFEEIDRKLSADKETIESHTRQLNEQEGRVSRLEGGNKALCHGMLALLEQDPSLSKATHAMKNYLIDGTYKESDWE